MAESTFLQVLPEVRNVQEGCCFFVPPMKYHIHKIMFLEDFAGNIEARKQHGKMRYCVKFSAVAIVWIAALSSNGKKPKVGCFYRFYVVYWISELVIAPKDYYFTPGKYK